MADNDELLIKLEREFQKEFEAQKKFYENKIELLNSEFKCFKEQADLRIENEISRIETRLKSYYDVKNSQDAEEIKSYYEKELASQRLWYEEEIKRRIKETENWHIKNLEEKLADLKKAYEEQLSAEKEKSALQEKNFKMQEEAFSSFIAEQKKIYEEQLKPFKKLVNLRSKISSAMLKQVQHINNKQTRHLLPSPPQPGEGGIVCTQYGQYNDGRGNSKDNEKLTMSAGEGEHIITPSRPKVSIILPVYNVGKYLRQSLDSLINQTLKDIEIICVNDGSTDNSYDILEEYKAKDSRIKVIHKSNKGTGAARNDGLRLASGECIAFTDPDDWVKPQMFERLYNLLKEKNLDIAMCMPDGWDEKNKKNAPFPYFVDDNFKIIPDDKIFNWKTLSPFKYPMCVWNKLYTKKLFDVNHIDFAEGLDFEDHKVIFGTLLTAERIFFIREKLYVYRFNREGSVLTDNNRRLIDHIKIFDIVENLMKETNTYKPLREDFLEYKIHNILYYYSMIKEEFKKDYFNEMIKSLKETNLTKQEYEKLAGKYPELKTLPL